MIIHFMAVELNDGWVVNELGIENYVKGVAEAGVIISRLI